MFDLSEQKQKLLSQDGNLLVLGGPGSGKTTIALIKAKYEIQKNILKSGQKILFLSFARATVSRVEEQISEMGFDIDIKRNIEINTYHGFTWEILKSHGYLLNGVKRIKLLPPPDAAAKLAEIKDEQELVKEKQRLFWEDGILHFDLFAEYSANLFVNSEILTSIYCDTYPIIILDEFQDTNYHEWLLIKRLGNRSRIIALADPEQRIYEFRGADPKRIKDYIDDFHPSIFDFEKENNRSNGTDILKFGNDLLAGNINGNTYQNVSIKYYANIPEVHNQVKLEVLLAMQRLNKGTSEWSLAILVPSKQLMLQVSDCLSKRQNLKNGKSYPILKHEVALEKEALALSAVLIAGLMEQGEADLEIKNRLIYHLVDYIRGRKGAGNITQADLKLSKVLIEYLNTGKVRGSSNANIITDCITISHECSQLQFSGNPSSDWILVRDIIKKSNSEMLKSVEHDSLYLRLLHKGSVLQSGLSELWRERGNYKGAISLVRSALLQEHFSKTSTVPKGIQIMTIHKAKGKEFDEVIIYEGIYNSRIVYKPEDKNELYKSQRLLRVAVTRAIRNVTLMTPINDKCVLLK